MSTPAVPPALSNPPSMLEPEKDEQ
jgi:hypothetical protein